VTYVGGSAGAHIVCGDLAHVARYDAPPDGMTDLRGLGLTDMTLLCHFTPARESHLDELITAGHKVVTLTDEQSIVMI
jgi:peptidase E